MAACQQVKLMEKQHFNFFKAYIKYSYDGVTEQDIDHSSFLVVNYLINIILHVVMDLHQIGMALLLYFLGICFLLTI